MNESRSLRSPDNSCSWTVSCLLLQALASWRVRPNPPTFPDHCRWGWHFGVLHSRGGLAKIRRNGWAVGQQWPLLDSKAKPQPSSDLWTPVGHMRTHHIHGSSQQPGNGISTECGKGCGRMQRKGGHGNRRGTVEHLRTAHMASATWNRGPVTSRTGQKEPSESTEICGTIPMLPCVTRDPEE